MFIVKNENILIYGFSKTVGLTKTRNKPKQTNIGTSSGDKNEIDVDLEERRSGTNIDKSPETNKDTVSIMNAKNEDRTTSFFAQPGILAGKLITCS